MDDSLRDNLYADPRLAQFYDLANKWAPDFDFCTALAADATSVLDLGCGTGELTAALAPGRRVVGIDPAAAMLDVARARPGGDKATWVEGDARHVRLDEKFDLIVLTGHTFQVFLTDADQSALLATIAAHLAPEGRFIFDSRNPYFSNNKEQGKEQTMHKIVHPKWGEVDAWCISLYDENTGILNYRNCFQADGQEAIEAELEYIRYSPKDHLERLISDAGLCVDEWFGDWQGNANDAKSREIIPLGKLA
ncbi:MAG: class I SAM-dependent methyltransferase [Rhizobiales bacterium]|nr:class I SAM-dependent methyltransferase [Hyphomicrobiales bacterium]